MGESLRIRQTLDLWTRLPHHLALTWLALPSVRALSHKMLSQLALEALVLPLTLLLEGAASRMVPQHAAAARRRSAQQGVARRSAAWTGGAGLVTVERQGFTGVEGLGAVNWRGPSAGEHSQIDLTAICDRPSRWVSKFCWRTICKSELLLLRSR